MEVMSDNIIVEVLFSDDGKHLANLELSNW